MANEPYETMKKDLFARIGDQKMAGLSVDDLRDAMSHPKAAETVRELMPYEAASPNQGEPAPEFTLPWLKGHEGEPTESFSLSARAGKRPVALIFGSYT